ncbi:MAG: hypothetical protein KDB79_06315 [Acidobacteria bacterium]|nr:hypothetical protein [Acidobacteriota bacterium]
MKTFITVLLLGILTACGQGNLQTQKRSGSPSSTAPTPAAETVKTDSTETECKICDLDFNSYKGDLKKEEVDGLLLALNDEYMAFATYTQINKDFNDPRPFVNIVQAEAKHADRLKVLFETYKIPVPENKWIGSVPKFESVAAACKAGVDAEIANRDLYSRLFKSTEREDILMVYRALQKASEDNHLPAFERCGGGRRGNR